VSVLRAAERYVGRGFAVVPVPHRKKGPTLEGWEGLRLTTDELPEHFNGKPQNIGLVLGEPSGGLVDVDHDVPEAAKIAGRFLPPTVTSGREGSPHSHWWYVSPGAETVRYKDVDGRVLVELRSTGCQTIVERSEHPCGERVVWHRGGLDLAEVETGELSRRVRELATAALIARHVPPAGGRHDFAMPLAGFLLRSGRLDEGTAIKIVLAAWHAAGADTREAVRDLEGIVQDTVENLAAGEPVVGGPSLEELAPGVVRLLCKWWGWERKAQEEEPASEEKEDRRNQADRLIALALEDAQGLFVDQHGAPHVLVGGEPLPLNSRCYSWLRRLMWEREERAVNGEYLKTAAGTLAAHAEFSGDVRELHTRAAWHQDALYYELRPGRVLRVGAGGWTFEANPPVLFRHFPNLKPLPDPEPSGDLKGLAGYANLKTSRDKRLFTAYAITLPLPHVGRPILNASGAMGSGKTTIQRLLKRTLDPTAPEIVRFDPRDFLQKASHAYLVMLDNQNTVPEWAADTLCRLVTGEADSKRRLYTDDEDVIIELRRAVLLNGINVPTDRGDVLDRSLVVELERIPDGERKTEEELWERFEAEHPKLLGSLFDALSQAIARKPSLKLSRRPRLADWGEYAASVYEVMGWGAETFLSDWDEVVKVQNQATLDGSPVAQAVIKFMEDKEEYTGTSSELHGKLEGVAESLGVSVVRDKAWPKSARWLWRRVKEVLPLLAAAGIDVKRERPDSGTVIALRKVPTNDATNASTSEPRSDKGQAAGNKEGANASSNASSPSNASHDASEKPARQAGSGNTGITGIRSGDSSEEVSAFLEDPPDWYRKQVEECKRQGVPERLVKPLASAIAYEVLGNTNRWSEVLPHVEAALREKRDERS
jgi:hypothetical protein